VSTTISVTKILPTSILLVVVEYGLGLESGLKSIFAGLGLGKICNQVHFQFSLCTFAVFCLGHMTFCQPASYTQPNLRYLLNIYCGINTWTSLFRFHLQYIDLFAARTYCN